MTGGVVFRHVAQLSVDYVVISDAAWEPLNVASSRVRLVWRNWCHWRLRILLEHVGHWQRALRLSFVAIQVWLGSDEDYLGGLWYSQVTTLTIPLPKGLRKIGMLQCVFQGASVKITLSSHSAYSIIFGPTAEVIGYDFALSFWASSTLSSQRVTHLRMLADWRKLVSPVHACLCQVKPDWDRIGVFWHLLHVAVVDVVHCTHCFFILTILVLLHHSWNSPAEDSFAEFLLIARLLISSQPSECASSAGILTLYVRRSNRAQTWALRMRCNSHTASLRVGISHTTSPGPTESTTSGDRLRSSTSWPVNDLEAHDIAL